MIQSALILANICMGLTLAVLEMKCYLRICDPVRWIRIFYALIGVFWAVFYTFMLITNDQFRPEAFQALVRPGITVTLAAMASGAIIRSKTRVRKRE